MGGVEGSGNAVQNAANDAALPYGLLTVYNIHQAIETRRTASILVRKTCPFHSS
jgi:hypothetical protein